MSPPGSRSASLSCTWRVSSATCLVATASRSRVRVSTSPGLVPGGKIDLGRFRVSPSSVSRTAICFAFAFETVEG